MQNTPNESNPPKETSNDKSKDVDGLLGMGGMLGGFSQFIQQLGNLAEKGEQLKRASQSDPSDPTKKMAGSFGYSLKFGGESFGGSRSTESFSSEDHATPFAPTHPWRPKFPPGALASLDPATVGAGPGERLLSNRPRAGGSLLHPRAKAPFARTPMRIRNRRVDGNDLEWKRSWIRGPLEESRGSVHSR